MTESGVSGARTRPVGRYTNPRARVEPDGVPTEQVFPIGTIAVDAGVTVATIRYYEEVGLIEPACRVGGKRRFTGDTVGRVNFVRRAQHVGFSLEEIKLILDDQHRHWPVRVEAKIAELRQRSAELDAMIELLHNISECGCHVVAECSQLDRC